MLEANRNIEDLKSEMAIRVRWWLEACERNGLKVLITETKRTKRRQLFLWSKGRFVSQKLEKEYLGYDDPAITQRGQIGSKRVTWTLASRHLDGNAIDFGFMVNGKFTYEGDWDLAYNLAELSGLSSLYRQYGIDKPHLQFNLNWTKPDPVVMKAIDDNEKILAQKSRILNGYLYEYNAIIKYLSELKGVEYKSYKITR